jgi:hypothetical protein
MPLLMHLSSFRFPPFVALSIDACRCMPPPRPSTCLPCSPATSTGAPQTADGSQVGSRVDGQGSLAFVVVRSLGCRPLDSAVPAHASMLCSQTRPPNHQHQHPCSYFLPAIHLLQATLTLPTAPC